MEPMIAPKSVGSTPCGAGEEVGRDHPVALAGEALAEADELGGHAVALVDDDDAGAGGGGVGGGDGEGGEREFGHGRTLPRSSAGRARRRGYPRRPLDGTRRPTPQSQGHALGGERHLRAHGRPGVRRPLLRRRADGRRGPRARGAARRTSRTRCARCACSPPARRATPRRCRACCTCSRRSSAWATPPSTSPASSPTGSASPPRWSPTSPPPRRSRTGCACGPTALLAHRSLADAQPADRGRDARRRHPARQGLDDRPRRRRHAAARRRADPARARGRHRRAARARRRARVAPAGHRRRSRRSPPTSTAPSTCWWR